MLPEGSSQRRDEAGGGQPAEPHREEQDQHDPQPEARDRQPAEGHAVGEVVPDGVAARRREARPAGIAMASATSDARAHASSRVIGSFLATVRDHRLPRADGLAEVAAQRAARPSGRTGRAAGPSGRTSADLLEPGGVGVGPRHHARGIAGDHAHAGEHDDADHEQGRPARWRARWIRKSSTARQPTGAAPVRGGPDGRRRPSSSTRP